MATGIRVNEIGTMNVSRQQLYWPVTEMAENPLL